jgi:hypothetical protein
VQDVGIHSFDGLLTSASSFAATEIAAERFPQYINKPFALQCAQIKALFTTWPMFRRTAIACLMMFFQQMSGIE